MAISETRKVARSHDDSNPIYSKNRDRRDYSNKQSACHSVALWLHFISELTATRALVQICTTVQRSIKPIGNQ